MDGPTILEETPVSPAASETLPRFPGEDGGQSLAEMAQRDLDAALQLLADRAQYITGACGAAIALRRNEQTGMVCRAAAGSHAPELGTLLSMEHGLSGESVRTRRGLRCDDADTDTRVNREGCLQLGIASVLVVPIVSDDHVLGVFELFSAKPHAFDDRDLAALARLSEMVETAINHSLTVEVAPIAAELPPAEVRTIPEENRPQPEPAPEAAPPRAVAPTTESLTLSNTQPHFSQSNPAEKPAPEAPFPPPLPKKPLFWFAPVQTPATANQAEDASQPVAVPATLRNFQKCQACGFPISQGRTFCVECEEKRWQDQRHSQTVPQ
jgi:hypothetical protein